MSVGVMKDYNVYYESRMNTLLFIMNREIES